MRYRGLRSVRLYLVVTSVLLGLLVHLIDVRLLPPLTAIAEMRAKMLATQAINEAIITKIADDVSYGTLISVHLDRAGRPAWAQVNTMEVNRIVASTTLRVQQFLERLEGTVVAIPLGQALGSPILANFGPRVQFTIIPVGAVNVEVADAFESAGINQTRHKIYLQVYATVQVVIPFVSQSVSVRSQLPIADVTYLGEVPQAVFNLPFPLHTGLGVPPSGERPPLPTNP
ncbi:MAG: sporulation protein YunB [Firmicutes bacterium]|nr:sporulation protein YunB [Dethiobacter sp.]MBS3888370.1 sporulation protein YunB [Bacillota bacterium]